MNERSYEVISLVSRKTEHNSTGSSSSSRSRSSRGGGGGSWIQRFSALHVQTVTRGRQSDRNQTDSTSRVLTRHIWEASSDICVLTTVAFTQKQTVTVRTRACM